MQLQSYMTAIPSAFATGVSPYFTLLVLSLGVRLNWIQSPPQTLEFVGSWWMLTIVGVLYTIEIAMGIIPIPAASKVIRIIWNVIHQVVTPLAAALVGVATAGATPEATLSVGAMSSAVAIVPQTIKSAGQEIVDMAPIPGKILIFNFIKDSLLTIFLGFYIFALEYPGLMAVMVVLSFGLMTVLTLQMGSALRWLWFHISAIMARFTSLVSKRRKSDTLPSAHIALLEHQTPELVCKAMAQKGVPKANMRSGYLSIFSEQLFFTYKTLFGYRLWKTNTDSLLVYFHRGALLNVHDLHYTDVKGKQRIAHFVTLKSREPLARQLAERFSARVTTSDLIDLGDRFVEGAHKAAESTADGAKKTLEQGRQAAETLSVDLKQRTDQAKVVAFSTATNLGRVTQERVTEIREVASPTLAGLKEGLISSVGRLRKKEVDVLPTPIQTEDQELER